MMADKIPKEMVIPSCSKYEDQTDCETSTNKRSLYKSNALCERTSEQSLSDVIQKLTRQIEHIENISKCQNVTKNIKVNDISCDDELIYQPPNKIIKYDNDIISTNFCNSDENSIGSTNKINPTTKHVSKKVKLDKNIIFQKDVDDSESSDSVCFPDQADQFNTSVEHVFNELMLGNNKISFSTEDQSMSQSNVSESSMNKSDVYLNVGEILGPEMCDDNLDNSMDQNNVLDLTKCDIDEIIVDHENCTSVTNEGINCTTPFDNVNSVIQKDSEQKTQYSGDSIHETDLGKMVVQDRKSCESTINIDNQETILCKTLNNQEENIFESSSTVDDLRDVNILEAVRPKIISKKRKIQDDLLVVTTHVSDENACIISERKSMSQSNYFSESSINKSDVYLNVGEIIVPEMCDDNLDNSMDQNNVLDLTKCDIDEIIADHENCTSVTNEGINCTTDFGKMVVQDRKSCESTINIDNQETILCKTLNNQEENIFESSSTVDDLRDVNILEAVRPKIISKKRKIQDDLLVVTTHVSDENACIISERKSMSQSHYFSESNINKSDIFVNVGEILVPEMCDEYLDNRDFGKIIVQDRKACESTINIDNQETVCKTLNNEEENIFEPSSTVDDLRDVNILEAVRPKIIDCENNFNQKDFLDNNEYLNEEIMSENENVTCKSNLEQKNKGTLKILTIEEEEMLTKLLNNEDEELGIVTDYNDKTTVSQTCDDYVNENISKKRKIQDDLLVVTTHVSDENACIISERKSMSQSHYFSESNINKSDIFVNVGEILVPEMCDEYLDKRDFGKIIVQERKSCESTLNIDNQETVCKTLNNQEENIFERSSTVDDLRDVNILEAVHPKIIDCENNFNQKDLLHINEYVNEEMMSENENVTCKSNLEQKNKGTLKILTIEEEETLTKLLSNEDEELGIVTDYKDKTTVSQTCEDYVNENISKKRKIQDNLLVVTTYVSDENFSIFNEGIRLDQTDKPTISMNYRVDKTILNNKEIDNSTERHFANDEVSVMPVEVNDNVNYNSLSPNCCCSVDDTAVDNFEVPINERNSPSSVTGDEFISSTFYFGTENCRDVSVHTIHSLDAYEMNNSLRNNTTVHSMENNDSLVSLNKDIENSIVELYCNSDNTTLSGIENKSYNNEQESARGIMKHTIKDIAVSLESSNSFHLGLINLSKKNFENILEPVDESCINSESIITHSNTNPLDELQRTLSEIYGNNNNFIDTSDKSISEGKFIESRRDNGKIPSDFDKPTMSQIVIENNAHKINDSANISDQGDTNTSNELMLEKSMMDNDKIFSTEDRSMSQSNYFSESSINKSDVYLNVGEIIVPEMCDDNLDNSMDQNNVLDLTKCDIDEIIVDHENCTSVTNEGINCTTPFDNVNSVIQKDSEQKTLYSGDSIHETDLGKMVVQDRKSCESTINIDNQETVCKTLNNEEENIFESSSTVVDGLRDVNILEAVHPKIIDCENNFNQKDFLDNNEYLNEEIMSENENVTCKSNLEQKNKGTLKILTIEEEETLTKLLNNEDEELGIVTDYKDKTTVSQTCEDYVNENISKKRKIQDDLLVVTTHVSDENACIISERKSMSQSNYFSESSINKSDVYLNVGEIIVPEMCDDNLDNSMDQNNVLDLTKCDIDEIIVDHENCTSVTNEGINCTMDFGKMVVQDRKSCESTINIDNQETECKTLNNQEENIFEPSSTVDGLRDVNILEAVHPKIIDCENNFNLKDLLHINEYVNEEIMSENENVTCKSNLEQKNNGTLKILTIEEEETLTKLLNNEDEELGIVTDYKDKTTVSQTCEDYVNENISKKRKIQDDLLVVTTHVSVENYSMVNERKTSLSFNSSDARQILESSNDDSEHFDDSLLFKPSDRDLVRYGLECEAYEKSISQSLNNLENDVSYKEVIPQCNTPISINKLVSSSYVKDYEDNVIDFYDCELSSIENSDVEDNLLLSFVKDTSMDDCIFEKNQNKLKNATNSTSNEQTCDTNLKIPNLGSLSESCNNLTNVVSLIHSPSHDHQYNEIISTISISKTEMQKNPDADDKLESVNSNNTISSCNAISSFNDPDNINNIQSNNLCIDQGNFNEHQNLEDSIKSHNQNNKNKSISGSNTQQNIKKSQKSYGDNESETESSMKITGNCTIPKSNIEEIPKTNTVQSSSSIIDQSEIDKKKYLDEIIKNEQLFNKFDEKLDVNESAISPFISQSLAKSTNLKGALAKKAAAHINIHDMGDKALSTYLTQQTMTLDVLEVLHKSLDTCPSSSILMEDPEGLVVPLMPHQKHAIAWLIWRESQEPHGGILADDMGLGKTLSMISLILKSKEKKQDILLPVVSIDNGRNDVINGGTLVICPASLINQWETEVKTKLKPGLLKVVQYYGMNRNCSALELAKNDLVITSYKIVMFDQKKQQNTNPLCRIKWDRIILDEGHTIRNHKTLTSVAVCNIKSLNRWAITGTPIHNKEADFFTLLKFMRCKPFDDWAVWKRWVGNNDDAGKHRLSLLVKTLMLRRTKSELTQLTTFNLPKKEINTIEINLSKEERNAYENLLKFSSNLFATYLYDRVAKEKVFDPNIKVQCKVQYFQDQNQDKAEVFKDHPELLKLFKQFKNIDEVQTYHILVLLLRLRQICCHPILIKGPITEESIKKEDNMESILEDDTDVFNNDSDIDNDTFPNNIDLSELMSCLTLEDEPVKKKPVIESNIFQKSWISTKIKKICDLVNEKVLIDGNGDKAIIVSQWPSFLYLIREHLAHYNAKMEMFSGAIPIPKRNKIIRDFNNPNSGPQILLLSLKAGGVGLNLMAANHMFLVDIHWNPQLEAQACDRVYRVGQNKPVHVYKFICSNTIETRIMNIQTHKLQMADNLFKGTSIKSKITIDDLKQIFQFH